MKEADTKLLIFEQAVAMMARLAKTNKEVGVFVDGGWGDVGQHVERTIITDGNGQKPHAAITKETFDRLRAGGVLDGNSLVTYKARRYHQYIKPGKKGLNKNGDGLYRDNPYPIPVPKA